MASINRILGILKNSVVEIGSVKTLDQTFVAAEQDQDVNLTANTPEVIPFNVESRDVLGEFDGGQFTPETSGYYNFLIHMEFGVGSDQDELKVDVFDVGAGQTVFESEIRSSGGGNRDRSANAVVDLEEGKSYSVRAENSDNSDTVNGKPKRTRLRIIQEPGGITE